MFGNVWEADGKEGAGVGVVGAVAPRIVQVVVYIVRVSSNLTAVREGQRGREV